MIEINFIFLLSVFIAGVLTFLAPCTLPMIPAYLGYISGIRTGDLGAQEGESIRARVLKAAAGFVSGFSFILISLGVLAGFAGGVVASVRGPLTILGGILMVLFGLALIGVLRVSLLMRERRFRMPTSLQPGTPYATVLLGMAFAFGWTPCIGPILGAVLTVAGSTETVLTGAGLLFVFSAGYATPFLGVAYFFSVAEKMVQRMMPFLNVLSKLGGVVLLIVGVHLIVGNSLLTDWFYILLRYADLSEYLLPYL